MRHRRLSVAVGQDPLPLLGKVLWHRRRANADDVVVRVVAAPHPHVRIEVWRQQKERVVCLRIDELAEVSTAMLRAPRALASTSPTLTSDVRAEGGPTVNGSQLDPPAAEPLDPDLARAQATLDGLVVARRRERSR